MRLGELQRRLNVNYRHLRYLLERGILPKGVDPQPGSGVHRDLTPKQAYWLAITISLKANGLTAPLAGRLAEAIEDGLRGAARQLNWDRLFDPFQGDFRHSYDWYADVADLKYWRLATTSNPSCQGLYEFPWSVLGQRKPSAAADPLAFVRLDLGRLADRLAGDAIEV